jgi:WD40 repeat protein
MLASAIRELAASENPTWIAAAFFEETVQIWDLNTQNRISEFPTVFCAGARNLALAPSAAMLVAGASTGHGEVVAYEVPSGKRLWERNLVFPSSLLFHLSGQSIFCTDNQRSVIRLDIRTGNTIEVIDGIRRYIQGPSGDALSIPVNNGSNAFHFIARGHSFDISRLGFALLDAQFSPHFVCLSEARGPVRCIGRVDGRLRWTFDPGTEKQVLKLHYSPRRDAFFGILRDLKEGGSRQLMRFDATSGVPERVCDLNSWEEVFLDAPDQLVTSAGEIRDLSDGALVGRLAFPSREYPDD